MDHTERTEEGSLHKAILVDLYSFKLVLTEPTAAAESARPLPKKEMMGIPY